MQINDPHLIYQILVAGVLRKEREGSVEEIKQSETVFKLETILILTPPSPEFAMISDEAEMYLTDVDKAFLGSRNKKQRAG